jgi:hypothetical protein
MNELELNVKKAIASILKRGILATISAIQSNKTEAAIAEAYHAHNLPHLLLCFSPELLRYYWKVERPDYIGKTKREFYQSHEEDWEVIRLFLNE